MRKHRLLLLGLATCVIAGGAAWFALPRRVNEADFETIVKGMTRHEVETLLSTPPDNKPATRFSGYYTTRNGDAMAYSQHLPPPWNWNEWVGRTTTLAVRFDETDRVTEVKSGMLLSQEETWFDRIRNWFGAAPAPAPPAVMATPAPTPQLPTPIDEAP